MHPLRGWQGTVVRRRPDGAMEILSDTAGEPAEDIEPPVGTFDGQGG